MPLTPRRAAALAALIERWFRANARDLPWRRRRSGYTALVAELMLQQTQAARVTAAFDAFIQQFPTVESLAQADEQQVLAAWQGLGYYRRARHLHAAARAICERFGGDTPRDAEALRTLPGVGRYTAGAIASIVFGERAPIVDGNVLRVALRVLGNGDSPDASTTQAAVWRFAEALVAKADSPAVLNEGLMELGAIICTPAAPRCGECPLGRRCEALRRGLVRQIPQPRSAAKQRCVHHHTVVIRRGDCILLEQRPERGMWGGMWQSPTVESPGPLSAAALLPRLSVRVEGLEKRGRFVHQTTHRRVMCHIFEARSRQRRGVWISRENLPRMPLSGPQKRVVERFFP